MGPDPPRASGTAILRLPASCCIDRCSPNSDQCGVCSTRACRSFVGIGRNIVDIAQLKVGNPAIGSRKDISSVGQIILGHDACANSGEAGRCCGHNFGNYKDFVESGPTKLDRLRAEFDQLRPNCTKIGPKSMFLPNSIDLGRHRTSLGQRSQLLFGQTLAALDCIRVDVGQIRAKLAQTLGRHRPTRGKCPPTLVSVAPKWVDVDICSLPTGRRNENCFGMRLEPQTAF